MKRVGNLMERIASMDNLQEAFLRAARGKNHRSAVIQFRQNLDSNLLTMRRQLLNGTFQFGKAHYFTIYDPKKRTICAASFPERVAFHAMMRICHPVFDNYQIYDSYASRKGKGTYKALERACTMSGRYSWFVKLDVRRYFDSIDHEVLFRQLCCLFKDRQLLGYFRSLVDGYNVTEGCGLPIGNLTSQYFANHYLAKADHYGKESLGISGYVRYMDDMALFDNDKNRLLDTTRRFVAFIEDELKMELHPLVLNRTAMGLPFLGYVVHPKYLRLNGRSRRRFVYKMTKLNHDLQSGQLSQKEYAVRAACLTEFVSKADSRNFLHHISTNEGLYP